MSDLHTSNPLNRSALSLLLSAFLCLSLALPAHAVETGSQDIQTSAQSGVDEDDAVLVKVQKALDAQDYRTAVDLLTPLANRKNGEAAYVLGRLIQTGQGIRKSRTRAAQYFKISAEQGDARGQNAYGEVLAMGAGVRRNFLEASRWFARAAEQGHATAQFNLGYLYAQGRGVKRDEAG